jgi:ABC-type transporter Mla subunit MlaD
MQKAAMELREAGAHIEGIQKSTSSAMQEELRATLDAYQDYVNQFTQRVDYLSEGITDALSKMPQAIADASGQFLDQINTLSRTLEQGQHALDEAVDRLYGQ